MKLLDFIVIGASKSGTTSLHRYLSEHPELWLPPEKDAPFFADENALARGWASEGTTWFGDAPVERLWGTVTPRYMDRLGIARRIAAVMPDVRLVAILRNPIDRAFSQYRQQARRGKESREFAVAVAEQTEEVALRSARIGEGRFSTHEHRYLALGEYDRILDEFGSSFDPRQLLVVFTEELRQDPGSVLDQILGHLGVAAGFRPANLGERYHRGGDRERMPWLVPMVRRIAPARWLWRRLPARRRRVAFNRFFTRWSVVPSRASAMDTATRSALIRFFAPQVTALETRLGRPVPWSEFR